MTAFINEFQLNALPEVEIIGIKIDRHNREKREKLPKPEMLKFYVLLLSSGSFKEAARISRYSQATLRRYKTRFKKIGIFENSIKPEENFDFPKPRIDLSEYHYFLLHEWDITKRKPVIYDIPGT